MRGRGCIDTLVALCCCVSHTPELKEPLRASQDEQRTPESIMKQLPVYEGKVQKLAPPGSCTDCAAAQSTSDSNDDEEAALWQPKTIIEEQVHSTFKAPFGAWGKLSLVLATYQDGTTKNVIKKEPQYTHNKKRNYKALQIQYNEARTLNDLWQCNGHPNIVRLISVASNANQSIYIEYCDGGDLYDAIRENKYGVLSLSLALDITDGLRFIHNIGWIHSDLKPDNVLLEKTPKGLLQAKICDFGLARKKKISQSTGQGTPGYIAPEIVSREMCDHKADIFSLALLIWSIAAWKIIESSLLENEDKISIAPNTGDDIQVAYANGFRPAFNILRPPNKIKALATLLGAMWQEGPEARPDINTTASQLELIVNSKPC